MKPYFTAAYNGDSSCLEEYKKCGVEEIWTSVNLPQCVFGSGRLKYSFEEKIGYDQLGKDFRQAKQLGLKTSFLFNPACTGNKEFTPEGMNEIMDIAEFVNTYEVDYIVLGQPFLINAFRRLCPDVRYKISSHYNCNNIGKFELLLEYLNYDVVTVSQFANKNFRLLREVVGKWDPDRLEIMCTVPCIMGCPYRTWHSTFTAHGNELPNEYYLPIPDHPCSYDTYTHKNIAVSAMFVRNKDISYYQKLGINKFKIGERQYMSEKNIECVRYYTGNTDNGFLPMIFTSNKYLSLLSLLKRVNLEAMDGFYDKFFNEECDGTKYNCNDCDHCMTYADKVFEYHEDIVKSREITEPKEFFSRWYFRKYFNYLEKQWAARKGARLVSSSHR